MNNLEGRLG